MLHASAAESGLLTVTCTSLGGKARQCVCCVEERQAVMRRPRSPWMRRCVRHRSRRCWPRRCVRRALRTLGGRAQHWSSLEGLPSRCNLCRAGGLMAWAHEVPSLLAASSGKRVRAFSVEKGPPFFTAFYGVFSFFKRFFTFF